MTNLTELEIEEIIIKIGSLGITIFFLLLFVTNFFKKNK